MLNYIWSGMIIISFLCSIVTGRAEELSRAILDGADKAVSLVISMAGIMCLWTGIMRIAERGGLTHLVARILSPILCRLMPDYDKDSKAMAAVCANITANLLGLGNAATPFGLAAMREMQKSNLLVNKPNSSMVMFVVLNTASIQLIPTTVAALRQAAGSSSPYSILPYVWITSLSALLAGIILVLLFVRNRSSNRIL